MKKILFVTFFIFLLIQPLIAKDVEFVLHKTFLQKLIAKIFPIIVNKESFSINYTIEIYKPVLSIHSKYVQLDTLVDIASIFGRHTFPSKSKFIPIFNPSTNNIEFKTIEGKINLDIESSTGTINIGSIDMTQYIDNIKIPLKLNNITVKDKNIKPTCTNVNFQLLNDKVVVTSDISM